MIRPNLTADGTAVRLAIADRAAPLLDELATAYAEDPATIGRLLIAHASAVLSLDYAACAEDMPDHVRAMRAAEADETRDALAAQCPSADSLDELLAPDDAISLAARITKYAAHIRHTQNRSARP